MGCLRAFGRVAGLCCFGLVSISVGCQSNAGTGALVGGGAGAGLGAVIGHQSHGNTVGGAVIGGAVGAIGGALVGNAMDESERKDQTRNANWRVKDPDPEYARRTTYADGRPISRADVIDWERSGISDDVVIDRIERGPTVFHLSAADENHLRDEGVSESVIRAMKETSRR